MSRAKLFLSNFFIYGMGNVLIKIVPFLMLPVLTRMITDPAIFGIFDLYTVVIRFCGPIVICGSYDAMFRLFFDNEDILFRKQVCSSALFIVLITSFSILLITFALWCSGISFEGYRWLVLTAGITIAAQAIQSIIAAPTRMQNNRRTFIVLSLLGPIVYFSSAIAFSFHGFPLQGLVLGHLLSILFLLLLYGKINVSWFSIKQFEKMKIKELLIIGTPLIPSLLVLWVFNACDRLMIGYLMGIEAVGLYGIGARLAAISQGIYVAFSGGWQYFAFSTMKDSDHTLLMSRVFETLCIFSIISLALLLPWVDLLFKLLTTEAYYQGAIVFPFLFISPLLLMLSQISGTQLMVVKKPYLNVIYRALGAVINVILNALLIPQMGILGAALGTALAYIIMTVLITRLAIKMGLFFVSTRLLRVSFISAALLFMYPFAKEQAEIAGYFLIAVIVVCYHKDVQLFVRKYHSRR